MTEENGTDTFHNEAAILGISLWANIIGYSILVFTLIGFGQQIYQLNANWAQIAPGLPENLLERFAIFTNILLEPLKGGFYFLTLRGISQLLNLGLDLFYSDVEIVEMEEAAPAKKKK